jgi:hypothetical protein
MKKVVEFNRKTNETVTRVFDDDDVPVSVVGVHNVTGKSRKIFGLLIGPRGIPIEPEPPGSDENLYKTVEPHFDRAYIRKRINSARAGAWRRGIEFDIVTKDIHDLLELQENRCYYTGWKFVNACGMGNVGASNKYGFSIDRLDSAKGYTRDNIVLCFNIINTSKGRLSAEEFIQRNIRETRDAYRAMGKDIEPRDDAIYRYVINEAEYADAYRKMCALQRTPPNMGKSKFA